MLLPSGQLLPTSPRPGVIIGCVEVQPVKTGGEQPLAFAKVEEGWFVYLCIRVDGGWLVPCLPVVFASVDNCHAHLAAVHRHAERAIATWKDVAEGNQVPPLLPGADYWPLCQKRAVINGPGATAIGRPTHQRLHNSPAGLGDRVRPSAGDHNQITVCRQSCCNVSSGDAIVVTRGGHAAPGPRPPFVFAGPALDIGRFLQV